MTTKQPNCTCADKLNCQCGALDLALGEKAGRREQNVTWQEAIERLKKGNKRYVSMTRKTDPGVCHYTRKLLCKGQWPFATILCCSDSRVPPEIIFDAGLGDLFIVRVAGNVLAPKLLGSIEYAAMHSTSRLIVVMGHEFCGAVNAAAYSLEHPETNHTPGMNEIINELMPAIKKAKAETKASGDQLTDAAARENVRLVCRKIFADSPPLRKLVQQGKVKIVGAYKILSSGCVEFFDEGNRG